MLVCSPFSYPLTTLTPLPLPTEPLILTVIFFLLLQLTHFVHVCGGCVCEGGKLSAGRTSPPGKFKVLGSDNMSAFSGIRARCDPTRRRRQTAPRSTQHNATTLFRKRGAKSCKNLFEIGYNGTERLVDGLERGGKKGDVFFF